MILKKTLMSTNPINKKKLEQNIEVFSKTVFCFLSYENPIYQLLTPPKYYDSVLTILSSIEDHKLDLGYATASSDLLSETMMTSKWKGEIEIWIEFLSNTFGGNINLSNVIANIINLKNLNEDLYAE